MQNMVENYGFGMFTTRFYEKTGFGHTGQLDGFQSYIMHFPNENVTVSCAFNGVSMPSNDVAIGILSIYSGLEYTLP